jgi:hypothetical protein
MCHLHHPPLESNGKSKGVKKKEKKKGQPEVNRKLKGHHYTQSSKQTLSRLEESVLRRTLMRNTHANSIHSSESVVETHAHAFKQEARDQREQRVQNDAKSYYLSTSQLTLLQPLPPQKKKKHVYSFQLAHPVAKYLVTPPKTFSTTNFYNSPATATPPSSSSTTPLLLSSSTTLHF